MKKVLFFWLLSIAAFAQVKSPATVTYRKGNTNQFNMRLSQAGAFITPSSSVTIIAEIRASAEGRVLASFPLSLVDSTSGISRGTIPDLPVSLYILGLNVKRSQEPSFYAGITKLQIIPTGELKAIADPTGLNIRIDDNYQIIEAKLDDSPSAAISAYYANQARAATDTVVTSVATIRTYANSATNAAAAANTSVQTALTYKNSAQVSADSALIRATRTLAAKASALLSEQNALASKLSAQVSADSASVRANKALTYRTGAQVSADSALARTNRALTFKNSAGVSADSATARAARAGTFATNAAFAKTGAEQARDAASASAVSAAQSASAAVAAFKGAWTANTTYQTGDLVTSGGTTYRRKASGTSGSSFDSSQWDVIALGGSVADNAVTTAKVADAAVTLPKTAFSVASKNLFNKATATPNSYILYTDGTVTSHASYSASALISVQPSTWYYPTFKNQLAYYTSAGVYISGDNSVRATNQFQTPANAAFVRLTVDNLNTFQLEAGQAFTGYEPYGNYINPTVLKFLAGQILTAYLADASITNAKISDASVGTSNLINSAVTLLKTNFAKPGKNLFNPSTEAGTKAGFYVNSANGNIDPNASYTATGLISVQPSTWYYPTFKHQLAYYTSSGTFISGEISTRLTNQFQTPANAAYVRLTIDNVNTFQLEAGQAFTGYYPYKLIIDPDFIQLAANSLADAIITNPKLAAGAVSVDKTDFLQPGGKNLFSKYTTSADGLYMEANGNISSNAAYCYSDFIKVTPGLPYSGKDGNNGTMRFVTFYDANRSVVAGGYNYEVGSFTPPVGVAYVRITIRVANKASFQLEQNTSSTAFEPYVLEIKTPGGIPVQASYVSPTAIQSVIATVDDPLAVAIAPKLYIPVGKEVAVYVENVHRYYTSYRDKTDLIITGGTQTGRAAKFKPTSVTTTVGSITVGNKTFDPILTKSFSVVSTDATRTTPVKIMNIGDSFTYRSTFANSLLASSAASGVTFLGIRNSSASSPTVKCEGRGGWAMSTYSTLSKTLYSPFVQPLTGSYLYLGNTQFWKNANAGLQGSVGNGYDENNFNVANQFSPSTGYPNSPRPNDVVYDNGLSQFLYWSGSAWTQIDEATLNFGLSFAKYRQTWGIDAPDIVHILLTTNDFSGTTGTQFAASYSTFKTRYDALIAAIKADVPGVKIIIGIAVPSGLQGEFGTLTTERRNLAFWLAANNLINDYSNREGENIYVNDYHSCMDRVYGYDNSQQKPFDNYTGSWREDYKADNVHLGADGFSQMGDRYFGLIQLLRNELPWWETAILLSVLAGHLFGYRIKMYKAKVKTAITTMSVKTTANAVSVFLFILHIVYNGLRYNASQLLPPCHREVDVVWQKVGFAGMKIRTNLIKVSDQDLVTKGLKYFHCLSSILLNIVNFRVIIQPGEKAKTNICGNIKVQIPILYTIFWQCDNNRFDVTSQKAFCDELNMMCIKFLTTLPLRIVHACYDNAVCRAFGKYKLS